MRFVTVERISSYKLVKTINNVIVTPCSVSLAIGQSPSRTETSEIQGLASIWLAYMGTKVNGLIWVHISNFCLQWVETAGT